MKKKFLIIQLRPEDETADNEMEAIMRVGGLSDHEVERMRAEQTGIPAIDLDRYAAIIVGGSPFDISKKESEKTKMQIRVERDFRDLFDSVVPRDFPFLGACSGSGLLGSYCGASVSAKYGEPVSGIDVHITEEGARDPLLRGLPETFRALVGHKEACDVVPPGATLLARGDSCPVQMFRLGRNVYATQFHPEADAGVFSVRIKVYKNFGYFPPEEAEALDARIAKEDTPVPKEILRRFVERCRAVS